MTDFMNALAGGVQARLGREKIDEIDRRKALAPDAAAAIGGDTEALKRIGAADPDYALKIAPILDNLKAHEAAAVKRAADFTTTMGMGLLNTPREHQPAAYQSALAEMKRQFGVDTSKWPTEWGPAAEGRVHFEVNKAIPAVEYYKQQELNKREGIYPMVQGGPNPTMATGGGGPANAIGGIESGGQPNGGYGAVGPVANAQGNRAYGKYQVLDSNIGPWTQEILGKAMSPQEFLATPQAQDAVFQAKFGEYTKKYGPEGASRAWFAGEGGMNNPNAADVNGMTVQKYGQKFVANGGAGPQPTAPAGPQVAQAPPQGFAPTNTPAQNVPGAVVNMAPPQGGGEPQATGPGDGSGNPVQPQAPQAPDLRMLHDYVQSVAPGATMKGSAKGGAAYDHAGRLRIWLPDGRETSIEVPKAKDHNPPAGYEAVPGGGLRPIAGGPADPNIQRRLNVPPGYQVSPDGGLAFIPGGPADPEVIKRTSETRRSAADKAIPQTVTKGMQENVNALKQIDRALTALDENPSSVGGWGSNLAANIPGVGGLQNRELFGLGDPQGAKLRALIADIGSLVIHDRSGAAVTASEYPRLKPFVPTISDDPQTVRTKLQNFKAVYDQTLRDATDYYGPDNGFKPYTPATTYLEGGAPATAAAPQGANPPAPKITGAADQGRALFEARDAISKGAPPDAVKARLKQMGVDPAQLDAR